MAVGLFAREGGLFYGGGVRMLGVQTLGFAVSALFAMILAYSAFSILKSTIGIRVGSSEEVEGLDMGEHGVAAYSYPVETFADVRL